jgi:hypothetical protein
MNIALAIAFFAVLLPITPLYATPDSTETGDEYGAIVHSMVTMHKQADKNFPAHFEKGVLCKEEGDFDPNLYFQVLTQISLPAGRVLDYIYWTPTGSVGRPHLYLRKKVDKPFKRIDEYVQRVCGEDKLLKRNNELAAFLKVDGSSMSFFELIVFYELAGQFYLADHALYDDTAIVTSPAAIEGVLAELNKVPYALKMTEEQKEKARSIDPTPVVSFADEKTVEVTIVTFSKWGGFARNTYSVARGYPHRIEQTVHSDLVEYNCGINY